MADDAKADGSPKTVEFVFEDDPGYRVVAANAAWGGLTLRGDIVLDFVVDSTTAPQRVENLVGQDAIGDEVRRFPPERTTTRRRQVGVLLTIDNAESIAKFLLQKVATFRANTATALAKEQGK